ncbi:AMP-binding protein [Nocardioides sp. Soil805]|uniref:AMP-binding protein n=1 Tax=Nocardioides sp. Soil805 TaxID=1736416 RepID=UPI0007140A88|nr:AMP-binding protein [Nocardioides sp. Soil805]KRF36473.1 hypothetical protein ASG94_03205 [Nocardioides sp. Soil805]
MDEVAQGTTEATTLASLLWARAHAAPDAVAYHHLVRTRAREATEQVTWAETRALVEPLAAGLVGLGVEPGDRVAILSSTRADAVLGHLAVLCAGAATTVLDPASAPADVARLVHGSGSVVVLAEDVEQVDKLRVVRGDIRGVRKVVQLDGDYPDRRVMTLEALLAHGEDVLARDAATVVRRVAAVRPDTLATVLHPPGSPAGGIPGTHGDWVVEGAAAEPGGGDAVRTLDASLSLPAAHGLLAAQLARGFGVVLDAGRGGSG